MDERLKLLLPPEEIEEGAWAQINDWLTLPFLKKMVILPDCHQGYDLPVGSAVLLEGVIGVGAVGVDIGCGVTFINTKFPISNFVSLCDDGAKVAVHHEIHRRIPIGAGGKRDKANYPEFRSASGYKLTSKCQGALYQIGTLGGGNHACEIGLNKDNHVCVMIHSGSRNLGKTICDWYSAQGRFFDIDSELGKAYLADMNYALGYALENRKVMMSDILSILGIPQDEAAIMLHEMINENHNHASVKDGMVLVRKGATPADKGQLGVIPANMRDGVYVTEGLGNEEYLSSASHGCGRKFSRGEARRTISMDSFKDAMKGIVADIAEGTLDESPEAYKDAQKVIGYQEGVVVRVIDHVTPIINVKSVETRRKRK